MKQSILIIDDDTDICTLLKRFLESNEFYVETAFSGVTGLSLLKAKCFDVVLSDFRLPDIDGIEMIKSLKTVRPETQVIVITGYSDVKLAIQSVRSGAFEYVTKPIQPEEILSTIKEAIGKKSSDPSKGADAPDGLTASKKTKKAKSSSKFVTGKSKFAQELKENIELVAPTDMSVLILGETGTGKEVAARAIHMKSYRSEGPFVAIDCGALPKEIASSELFGHVKGSFTGALSDKIGSFEHAKGGTLFLDEIGNLSYDNQVKLLRVIQERKIKRVGGNKEIDIDVRIIVATNEDLALAFKDGDFREDLYYRLNEFKIELAPLRERQADLMEFASFFLDLANEQLKREVVGFSDEVIEKMKGYFWHGNLRELKNVVKRATLLTKGNQIELIALPQEIIYPTFTEQQFTANIQGEITDLKSVTEEAERNAIMQVLKRTNFNKTKTAEILNIDRKTLYNKITAYGIDG